MSVNPENPIGCEWAGCEKGAVTKIEGHSFCIRHAQDYAIVVSDTVYPKSLIDKINNSSEETEKEEE